MSNVSTGARIMPLIDIPGIVHIAVKLDYGRYQQLMTTAYRLLHREGLINKNKQSEIDNRVVANAIERTIQDLVEAAIVSSKPEMLVELLEENTRIAHKNLSEKFMTF
jgi:hypothetical protein